MPTLARIIVILTFPALSASHAQNCTLSGAPAWSKQVRHIIGGCEIHLPSPDGKLVLRIDPDGKMAVSTSALGRAATIGLRAVQPAAMVSWSPNSDAFFVNDGEGSGMSSVFRLFRLRGGGIAEDDVIEKRSVGVFRSLERCSPNSADPNVWGLGWSLDGSHLYVLIQSAANDHCGPPNSVVGLSIKAASGSIIRQMGTEEA